MAITSIKTGSSFTNLIKYNDFLAGNSAFNPSSYESIATFSATGSETTFTFTSIPSTYKHLQLRAIFQRNGGTQLDVGLRFNSDTGSNYSWHNIEGDGATVLASGNPSTSYAYIGKAPGTATSNIYGVSITDIHDYSSTTKNKTLRSFNGKDENSSNGSIQLLSSAWYNTNAISSITIYTFGDLINSGSTFALYGIKS